MEISRKRSVDAKLDLARHYAPGRRAREGRFSRSLERRGRRDKIGRTPMLRPPLSVAAAVVALGASLHAQNTPQAVPEDFVIKLERTSCFGPCPVYSVTIDGKGNVTYEGKKFVRVPGRQSDQIPVSRVAELVATIDRIRFFELNDEYRVIRNADGTTTMVSDLPTTFITVTRDGQTKSIEDYVGAPEPLHQLEKEIDEAARTRRWIFLDQATLRQQKSGRSFSDYLLPLTYPRIPARSATGAR